MLEATFYHLSARYCFSSSSLHYAAEMTTVRPAAQEPQKETHIREIHIAEVTTANARNAEHPTTMATARNADTRTSTRDGWEKTASQKPIIKPITKSMTINGNNPSSFPLKLRQITIRSVDLLEALNHLIQAYAFVNHVPLSLG